MRQARLKRGCTLGDTSDKAGPPVPVIPYAVSTSYADLHPLGYIFSVMDQSIRIVYYHEEPRITAEAIMPDGSSSFQVLRLRVQDVAVNIQVEDFVRLVVSNLVAIGKENPDLLEKYRIQIGHQSGQ